MRRADWTQEDIYRIAERGYSLHQQGRYGEAVTIFEGLVAVDPQNNYCREALAAAWLAVGEPRRALQQLDSILTRDSGHLSARARRFEAYLQLGDFTASRKDFEVLNRLLPAHEVRRLGFRFEAAIRHATLAQELR
jgi:tetratricopeptide (TPR) repeat protein